MDFAVASAIVSAGTKLISGLVKNELSYQAKGKDAVTNYQSMLTEANRSLDLAEATYNSIRDNITTSYGSDVFSLLEQQYNSINGIGAKAVSRKDTLARYETDIGTDGKEMAFREGKANIGKVRAGYDSNYENHSFSTDTTLPIVDQIYNLLSSGDSALAQQLRLSGNQMQTMLQTSQDEVNQAFSSYQSAIKQSALQARTQSLNNSLEIASSRATMASSGIRNTGTGTANENLTRLQSDLTNAYYAMNIKAQATQLQNEIYNTQKSASLSAYQTKASMEISQRQAYESVVSAYSSGVKQAEQYVDESSNYEEMANEYADRAETLGNKNWFDRAIGNF